jgi:hypothetical protein
VALPGVAMVAVADEKQEEAVPGLVVARERDPLQPSN